MYKNLISTAWMLGLVACGGGGDKAESGPGKDWSGKALDQTYSGKVNDVAFTLKGPAGMKEETRDPGPIIVNQGWKADLKDNFSEPGFTVSFKAIPAKTLEQYVEYAAPDEDDVIAKKEATADGFVLVTHSKNHGFVRVSHMKQKGDKFLECRTSQAKTGGVPNPAKTQAWLEQLCASLTIL